MTNQEVYSRRERVLLVALIVSVPLVFVGSYYCGFGLTRDSFVHRLENMTNFQNGNEGVNNVYETLAWLKYVVGLPDEPGKSLQLPLTIAGLAVAVISGIFAKMFEKRRIELLYLFAIVSMVALSMLLGLVIGINHMGIKTYDALVDASVEFPNKLEDAIKEALDNVRKTAPFPW